MINALNHNSVKQNFCLKSFSGFPNLGKYSSLKIFKFRKCPPCSNTLTRGNDYTLQCFCPFLPFQRALSG